jgi:hypothetical protein
MGRGLSASTSADGARWTEAEHLADAGFEPAACFSPSGAALVAYQRGGEIFGRSSRPGADWAAEAKLASGADRLREPALAWTGDQGLLAYAERANGSYAIKAKALDAAFKPLAGAQALPSDGAKSESRNPCFWVDHNGSFALAWGMKNDSGQQGVVVALP